MQRAEEGHAVRERRADATADVLAAHARVVQSREQLAREARRSGLLEYRS
jgi:hypothetical protein